MPAYTFSLNAGIPGQVMRSDATIEAQILDSSNQPTNFGVPVAIDGTSHKLRGIIANDTASSVFGFIVRPYPQQQNSVNPDFGGAGVPTSGVVDVLKRGYIAVVNAHGTPVTGGAVYMRVADADSTGRALGSIEAASDSTNTVQLTNAYFTGAADSNGVVEIAYNL